MVPEESGKNTNSYSSRLQSYLKYSGLAFQMIIVLGLAAFAGIKLDAYVGNKNPWFTILFMLLGVVGSIYKIIISIMK